MSELSFGIIDNNADFQQKTKQLREAIDGLETDFTNLYASAENSIKGIEHPSQRISLSAVFEY